MEETMQSSFDENDESFVPGKPSNEDLLADYQENPGVIKEFLEEIPDKITR